MKFRLLPLTKKTGAEQMAIDEAILNARINKSVPNTLRFYTWKPTCLTIGYFQSLEKEVDVDKSNELNVDIVRRYTGGGAVYHQHELTYSIVIDEESAGKEIIKSYEKICGALITGFKLLGFDAKFAPINDIMINGKKVSGNAQTRRNGIILQHGTILIDVNVKKMFSLLKVADEKMKDKMIAVVEERVTSLNKESGLQFDVIEVFGAMVAGFVKEFDMDINYEHLTPGELIESHQLKREKYGNEAWLKRR